MPRITKGSPEAKAWGEKMKAYRRGSKKEPEQPPIINEPVNKIKPIVSGDKAKRRCYTKGSIEAKEHMARLRSMRKKK